MSITTCKIAILICSIICIVGYVFHDDSEGAPIDLLGASLAICIFYCIVKFMEVGA